MDHCVLCSDCPDVVARVHAQPGVTVVGGGEGQVCAHIPLHVLAQGFLFPENKGLRKMAESGGNGSIHISH